MKVKIAASFLSLFFVFLVSATTLQAQTKKVNVSFKAGTTGASYNNTVVGYGTVDYYIKARGGQNMSVKLTSSDTSLYFVVSKSGPVDAIADDARDATEWSGALPDDGTYIVRVYLFRNAARKAKRPVNFKIRFDITASK